MTEGGLITTIDEFEAEYRKTIGETLAQRPTKQASLDNIRGFGDGIGDYNPLWRNQDHAAASRFGMITAPPTFLYSVALGVVAGETGNIERARVSTQYLPVNYAGVEIDFVRPVWRDDLITATERVGETVRKQSGRIGPINLNTGFVTYSNQRQEVVADVRTVMARYQNTGGTLDYDRAAKDAGAPPEPADPLVWERQRRGAETRYWKTSPRAIRCRRCRREPIRSANCFSLPTAYSIPTAAPGPPWRRRVPPISAAVGVSTPSMRGTGATCPASSTSGRSASAGWRRLSRTGWATTARSNA